MDGCSRRVLAQGGPVRVEHCGCGAVHLTIGPMTLRLDRGVTQDLSDSLAAALTQLAYEDARDAGRLRLVSNPH